MNEPAACGLSRRGPSHWKSIVARFGIVGSAMQNLPGTVRFTSPQRVIYPDVGWTKRDVAGYFVSVAPWMLPHLRDRPLSLVRCPKGCDPAHPCFFQKKAMRGLTKAVLRVQVPTRDGMAEQLVVKCVDGLVGLVQFGVLEFHVWGSTWQAPDRPDRMVIDLDPHADVKWARVVAAAFRIRDELSALNLVSFVKTTGGNGLHVVVPLTPGNTWDEVQQAATGISRRLVASAPNQFTLDMAKRSRVGKILLDCLRNARGATAVAPYSTRARPGAMIATPIAWEELTSLPRGLFDLPTVIRRLACVPTGYDPWQEMFTVQQRLTRSMLAALLR